MVEQTISVKHDIRAERIAASDAFQQEMNQHQTMIVRLLSSPGAGKTTLLEKTAQTLSKQFSVGILVGDIETERDAERLKPYAPTRQITTGGACHLELSLVKKHLPDLGSERFDFLFIEDVGNLICPASHLLGEHLRVIVLSTTEGDDKPGKYPKAFRTSQVTVINKIDLLPHVPFKVVNAIRDIQLIQPEMRIFELSAYQNQATEAWCEFLIEQRSRLFPVET